jgi:hypothetical protein
MRNHSNSKPVTNLSLLRKPGSAEEKMGRMGSVAGNMVDKVVGMPKHLANSAASIATETQANASRKASKIAKDLAQHLDPDPTLVEKAAKTSRNLSRTASSAVIDGKAKAASTASKVVKKVASRLEPDPIKNK